MIWGYHNFRKHPNSRPQKTPPTLTPSSHPKVIVFLPLHDWRKLYRPCSHREGKSCCRKKPKKKRCPAPMFFQQKYMCIKETTNRQPTQNEKKSHIAVFFFRFLALILLGCWGRGHVDVWTGYWRSYRSYRS